MKIKTLSTILFLCATMHTAYAQEKEIALTIDDLPFVGTNSATKGNLGRAHDRFTKIMNYLIDAHIPATGFIIANSIARGQWELLEEFRDAGFGLGNHTYSHANLNRMSAQRYIAEIEHADKILQPVMTQPKYFRYPYLAEGRGATKQEVQAYLAANHYIIAPVTVDSKDYYYNQLYLNKHWRVRHQYLDGIKRKYLDHIWRQTEKAEKRSKDGNSVQILLVHSNLLNSECLDDVIQMYKDHGYKFVTLKEALEHQANMGPTIEARHRKYPRLSFQ
ncbi:MAG: polysaccharide deacetylase family protein [Gammaproteobacteria bacterium]|nr:polysaccharide deacetylase family protein [Gammaproteobacteria bacterium]